MPSGPAQVVIRRRLQRKKKKKIKSSFHSVFFFFCNGAHYLLKGLPGEFNKCQQDEPVKPWDDILSFWDSDVAD